MIPAAAEIYAFGKWVQHPKSLDEKLTYKSFARTNLPIVRRPVLPP